MKLSIIVWLALVVSACVTVESDGPGEKAGGGTVILCHKGKTMELPEEASQAHLGHGDRLGPC
jgi:hypothetical protein